MAHRDPLLGAAETVFRAQASVARALGNLAETDLAVRRAAATMASEVESVIRAGRRDQIIFDQPRHGGTYAALRG